LNKFASLTSESAVKYRVTTKKGSPRKTTLVINVLRLILAPEDAPSGTTDPSDCGTDPYILMSLRRVSNNSWPAMIRVGYLPAGEIQLHEVINFFQLTVNDKSKEFKEKTET
jgi:hypothetical protein